MAGSASSAYAHSEVIRKLSIVLDLRRGHAMVPNSLGPGELLLQFGARRSRIIGCRGGAARKFPLRLTSPEAAPTLPR